MNQFKNLPFKSQFDSETCKSIEAWARQLPPDVIRELNAGLRQILDEIRKTEATHDRVH